MDPPEVGVALGTGYLARARVGHLFSWDPMEPPAQKRARRDQSEQDEPEPMDADPPGLTTGSFLDAFGSLDIKMPAEAVRRLQLAGRDTAQLAATFKGVDLDLGKLTREEMLTADAYSATLPGWASEWFLEALAAGAFPSLQSLTVLENAAPRDREDEFWTGLAGLAPRLVTLVIEGPQRWPEVRIICDWDRLQNLKVHSDEFFFQQPAVEKDDAPRFASLRYLSIATPLTEAINFDILAPNLRQLSLVPSRASARWIDDCTFPRRLRVLALSNYDPDFSKMEPVSGFVQRCFTNLENSRVSESIQTLSVEAIVHGKELSDFHPEKWPALKKLRMLQWGQHPGLPALMKRIPNGQLLVAVVLHSNWSRTTATVSPWHRELRLLFLPTDYFNQIGAKTVILKYDKSLERLTNRFEPIRDPDGKLQPVDHRTVRRIPATPRKLQKYLDGEGRKTGIEYIVQEVDDLNPLRFPFDEIEDVLEPR